MNAFFISTYHKTSIKDFSRGFQNCPWIWNWSTVDQVMTSSRNFFSSARFKSNRHRTSTYHKYQRFFPKDSKTALGFEIGPLGTELWLLQAPFFFQVLVFTSNRRRTSTYHKISIKDFFPRIPKLPSDLKLVYSWPSYGSANILLHRWLYRAFTIYEKYHP